jgi:hypothetical protein
MCLRRDASFDGPLEATGCTLGSLFCLWGPCMFISRSKQHNVPSQQDQSTPIAVIEEPHSCPMSALRGCACYTCITLPISQGHSPAFRALGSTCSARHTFTRKGPSGHQVLSFCVLGLNCCPMSRRRGGGKTFVTAATSHDRNTCLSCESQADRLP